MAKRVTRMYLVIFLVTCVVMFIPTLLSAQDFRPGYIVKNGGDTVKGFAAYQSGKKSIEGCAFRETRKGATSTYAATDIQGYGIFGDRLYKSIELPIDSVKNRKVFAKILVQGNLTLYQYREFYLLGRNDTLTVLPKPKEERVGTGQDPKMKRDNKYIGILNYMMLDCQMNANKASFSEGSLSEVVYAYNLCKKVGYIKQNSRPLVKLDVALFTGYVNSHLTYDHFKVIPFIGTTIVAGGGLDLYFPRAFDRVVFSLEAWYSKIFYQGYYEGTYAGDPLKEDEYAEFTTLKIPFGIKYNFRRSANTPYIRLGLFWSTTTESWTKTVSSREAFEAVLTDETLGRFQVKSPKGYWMSIGYDKTLYKDTRIFTEFRYERGEGYFGTAVFNESRLSNYNFLVGFRF